MQKKAVVEEAVGKGVSLLLKNLSIGAVEALSREAIEKAILNLGKITTREIFGPTAKLIESKITTELGEKGLEKGSYFVANKILKELPAASKISIEAIEEAVIKKGAEAALIKLEGNITAESVKKLSIEEMKCLNTALIKLTKAGDKEAGQILGNLLQNSAEFAKETISSMKELSLLYSSLSKYFVSLNPAEILASKMGKHRWFQKFLLNRGVVSQISFGIFVNTTAFGYLSNLFNKSLIFNNLEQVVHSIVTNLQSYNFDAEWAKIVRGIEERLNSGLKEYNDAYALKISKNSDINTVQNNTNLFITKTAVGSEKLRQCFSMIASSDFRKTFDVFQKKAASSTYESVQNTALNIAEKTTPVNIQNITNVINAAENGLKLIKEFEVDSEKILALIDQNIDKDLTASSNQTQKVTEPNQFDKVEGTKKYILDNFIKIAKMLRAK